jgi:RNA ligase
LQGTYPGLKLPIGWTVLTEIIFDSNQIVIDYAFEGLIVLGMVEIGSGRELSRESLETYCSTKGLPLVERFNKTLSECAAENIQNREGYVVSFSTGLKVKIKFQDYCRLHKIITGLNARSIWELLRDNQVETLYAWLQNEKMPQDFKIWLKECMSGLTTQYAKILKHVDTIYLNRPLLTGNHKTNRKKMAEYFMQEEHRSYSSWLFGLLDGKDISTMIWRSIEPSGAQKTFKVDGE